MTRSEGGRAERPAQRGRQWIIWFAFLGGCVSYVAIAAALGAIRPVRQGPIASEAYLKYLFYGIGATLLAASFLVRRRLEPGAVSTIPDGPPKPMAAMLAGLALAEAVPLLGLLLVLLGGAMADGVPLFVGGILGVLLQRPYREV